MTFASSQFETASLRKHPRGEAVARILTAAMNAVDSTGAVSRALRREGERLVIGGQTLDLRDYRRVVAISIGKAGSGMATGLNQILGDKLDTGLIVAKHDGEMVPQPFTLMSGGHPVPDDSSLRAGQRILHLASSLTRDDLLFCLISGGGSALVAVPVEGVTLADLQSLTTSLLRCGARVDEINTLRRALDRVKGGGIARAANGARIVTLVISDVVGDPLEAIASGPTIPSPTGPSEALAVLEKYHLREKVAPSIFNQLEISALPPAPSSAVADTHIIASNLIALQAALAQSESEGFHPYLLRANLQGEARQAGFDLANALRWEAKHQDPVPRSACLVAGGETTVTLKGAGRGGRNTELALAATIALAEFPNVMLVTLGTDGEDGPTDAAGAVVTGESWGRSRALGLDPSDYLSRNDSYSFFAALNDLLKPGPTGTNVGDLTLMFAF